MKICPKCGYEEPVDWMQSRHDFESEVALADEVSLKMPELWAKLQVYGADGKLPNIIDGAYIYQLIKPNPRYQQRVRRMYLPIWKSRGETWTRPRHYVERRDGDNLTAPVYATRHRLKTWKQVEPECPTTV